MSLVHPLEKRFAETLAGFLYEKVVAAVSGGGDSVALLYLLKSQGIKVVVAHLDHALREESSRDARWVESLAASLGYPCVVERVEVARIAQEKKANLEATARELRYAFLARVAKKHGAQAILTAHTQDDQAETVLLQLAQGTARAPGIRGRVNSVIRPLLDFRRDELRNYLKARGAAWLEDVTNQDISFDRNYLRSQVLPVLEDRFRGLVPALSRFSKGRQLEDEYLALAAERLLIPDTRWPVPAYRRAPLLLAPEALRHQALRKVLQGLGLRPERRLVELLERALRGQAVTLPQGVTARSTDGTLFFIPEVPVRLPTGWRLPEPGDYLDMPYGKKRLVEFLSEHGVPKELRTRWPVRGEGPVVNEVFDLIPEPSEDRFMRLALKNARGARANGEVPIGAVVVREGRVLAESMNQVEALKDSSAHAELLALQQAMRSVDQKLLPGAELYVTLEPCPLCYGAALEAQVSRVVYGTENLKAGALSVHGLPRVFGLEAGRLERDCARVLRGFFSQLRAAPGV